MAKQSRIKRYYRTDQLVNDVMTAMLVLIGMLLIGTMSL